MNIAKDHSYIIFDELCGLGYVAGTTLKSHWEDQVKAYEFIENNIMPPSSRVIIPNQVHGSLMMQMKDDGQSSNFNADGVITNSANLCLTVTTADCIPILAADPISGYFAAIHVGWRSFVAGIIDNLFQTGRDLRMNFGRTQIFLGASIGPCCFEVGPEVAALFDKDWIDNRHGSLYVDLKGAVQNRLISLGIVKENIGGNSDCTCCNPDRYYSYRRDKNSPVQMVTFIYRAA